MSMAPIFLAKEERSIVSGSLWIS